MKGSVTEGIPELYRTNDPKFTTYQGDGSGRDTYIVYDDGGFLAPRRRGSLNFRDTYNQSVRAGPRPGERTKHASLFR